MSLRNRGTQVITEPVLQQTPRQYTPPREQPAQQVACRFFREQTPARSIEKWMQFVSWSCCVRVCWLCDDHLIGGYLDSTIWRYH